MLVKPAYYASSSASNFYNFTKYNSFKIDVNVFKIRFQITKYANMKPFVTSLHAAGLFNRISFNYYRVKIKVFFFSTYVLGFYPAPPPRGPWIKAKLNFRPCIPRISQNYAFWRNVLFCGGIISDLNLLCSKVVTTKYNLINTVNLLYISRTPFLVSALFPKEVRQCRPDGILDRTYIGSWHSASCIASLVRFDKKARLISNGTETT